MDPMDRKIDLSLTVSEIIVLRHIIRKVATSNTDLQAAELRELAQRLGRVLQRFEPEIFELLRLKEVDK